jgi:hypothetical protein
MDHKPRVLFFSIGDSTRSQIAEGFLRSFAGDEFVAMSTATRSLEADPLAWEVMREAGIDISGQRAKDIKESLTEHFSYVVSAMLLEKSFPYGLLPATSFTGVCSIRSKPRERQNGSANHADQLVVEAIQSLATGFSAERQRLEQQWNRQESVSTEDLRQSLRRYRSFFERILSV